MLLRHSVTSPLLLKVRFPSSVTKSQRAQVENALESIIYILCGERQCRAIAVKDVAAVVARESVCVVGLTEATF